MSRNSGCVCCPAPYATAVEKVARVAVVGKISHGNKFSVEEGAQEQADDLPVRLLGWNWKGGDGTSARGSVHGRTLWHLLVDRDTNEDYCT